MKMCDSIIFSLENGWNFYRSKRCVVFNKEAIGKPYDYNILGRVIIISRPLVE